MIIKPAEHADELGNVTEGVLEITESGKTLDYLEPNTLDKDHEPKSVKANDVDRLPTGAHKDMAHRSLDNTNVNKPVDG